MKAINDLIRDEEEAIAGYNEFLRQEPHSKEIIFAIKRIIHQEEDHIKILNKLNK